MEQLPVNDKSKRRRVALFSACLYIFSMVLPGFSTNYSTHYGFDLVIMGAFGFLGGAFGEWIVWLANPLYIIALFLFLFRNRASIALSAIATLLAASFLFFQNVIESESGTEHAIKAEGAGYFLWLLSMIILWIWSARYLKKKIPV